MVNEPTFTLDPEKGGMNWGYCVKHPKSGPKGTYTAIIETSNLERSETTSAIKAILIGDLGKTNEFVLGDKFERGSTQKTTFTAKDVGRLHKIRLSLEGSQPYRCKKITIMMGPRTYNFECLKALFPCGIRKGDECKMESEVEGVHPYEITIKIKTEKGSGVKSPILVNILGKKGEGQFKMFSEKGLKDGEAKKVKVLANNVGRITGFKLSLPEPGKLTPHSIKIKDVITKETAVWLINEKLKNPGRDTIRKDIGQPSSNNDDNDEGGDMNSPNGGLLSDKDKNNIIELSCDSKLENPSRTNLVFGPEYPTNFPNYMSVLARCPSNCHKSNEKVRGVGLHPEFTPICAAAIVDNAVSYYGGIISISVLPGISKYTVPPNFKKNSKGMNVSSYSGNVKRSFSVTKVDNVDLVEKDLRILDNDGNLSHEGRLEMRVEGEWGTVCALGNNKLSAKRICMDMGYKDGEWKSPNNASAKNFCKLFNGKTHCGAKNQPIHFSNIRCTDVDTSFNLCNKMLADSKKCTHEFDAIINCFNQDYKVAKKIPQNVVRLEKGKRSKISYTGRLEMMRGKEFLPVCSLGFTNKSARVACKQMGWEKGKVIKNADILKAYQLPNDDNKGFSAENLVCTGEEKSVEECKFNINNINCKHDQDVVIRCLHGKGDPSGKSQYVKPVYNPPPELGKLKIAKFHVSCNDKGNREEFRGDPGSIYIIICPSNCGRITGSVWGTGIYTSNSHICRAAIHSGVIIGDKEEVFIMSRTHGLKYYHASDHNNIHSTQHISQWPASITFSSMNSGYKNMYKALQRSFFEIKNKITFYNPIQRLISSSFIQSKMENLLLPIPVFEWIQNDFTYNFNEKNNILITNHKLGAIVNNFSILTRFKMQEFKSQDQYIFSYSGCNGISLLVDKYDRLVLGDVCNPAKRYVTGYMAPLNDQVLFYFKYSLGRAYLRIYSYGTKKIYEKRNILPFEFPQSTNFGIGRMGLDKKDFFNGKIDFIQIYSSDVPTELLDAIVNNIKILPKPGISPGDKTEDERVCVSTCTYNPVPPFPGSGEPPMESNPYKPISSPMHKKKGDKGKTKNKVPGSSGTYDKDKANNIMSIHIDCQVNLTDRRFAGSPGKIFRVNCRNCIVERAVVFGTTIYHPLSSICKAAAHAGAIGQKGGDVIVEILPGAKAYNGSSGYDKSVSATFGASDRSFRVTKAPKLLKISCSTTAADNEFSRAPVGKKFVVLCPPKCSTERGDLWGTDVYTDTSSICRAGIHYGNLSDKGGEISFIIDGVMTSYKKSKSFGINSLSKGSHVRSFKFLGPKAAVNFRWNEDYTPKFQNKWKIFTHDNADYKLSNNWKYVIDPNFIHEGVAQKLEAIKHTGEVSVKNDGEYGSWIFLKNADFANGKIRFNIMLIDEKPMAALIRFVDKDNFLAVEFGTNNVGNVRLIERFEGSSRIIETKTNRILPNKWYRAEIILDFDTIRISLQSHKIRKHKVLIKKTINSLSRGTLGFATNGNKKFYINGISISEYNKNNKEKFKNNHYSWNFILKGLTKNQRKLYCQKIFNSLKEEIERCTEVHNFCQIRCDSYFPRKENILNFACTRDCTKKANILESQYDKLQMLLQKQDWVPKIKEKCDYRPDNDKFYRMGIIKAITKKGKRTYITVKYQTDINKYSKVEVKFPSKNLKRCGEALTARLDCNIKN